VLIKKRLIFLIISVTVLYLYPARPGTALHQVKSSMLGNLFPPMTSKDEIRTQLIYKMEELQTYENVLADIDNEHERMLANAPICPTTGRKASVSMTTDPRPEIQLKIEELNVEIGQLESRLD
jgi:hypothetical protein